MRSIARALLAATLAVASAGLAGADEFPSRPLRVIVPYAGGGPSDTGARLAAEALGRVLNQSVIVENRGGGGGLNATEAYLGIAPDGYTILVGSIGPFTIIPAAKHVGYDVEKDFIPLGTVWRSAQLLAARNTLGAATVAEFVARAKASPGKLTIGSAGVGAVTHLAIELLRREAAIDVIHVPFRSTGQTMPALLGDQIDALFGDAPILAPQVHAGKIQALAVAAPKRAAALPEVPTMGEFLPGFEAGDVLGLGAPRNTPPEIIDKLNKEINTALADPKIKARFADLGGTPLPLTPAEYGKILADETEKWGKVIRSANIKAE
jgi:tripartite-type tricarboxylate transporter receptor subunit TctC